MKGTFYLGYRGKNRQDLSYEIVRYEGNKKIWIKFDLDGLELKTAHGYLRQGLPLH